MNANDLIVSVSGVRGIVGTGLTPEVVLRFAAALGTYVNGGAVVLSRDSRPSGVMLRHAVLAGLMSAGCDVHDLDITPTPTVGLAVRKLSAAGAIQMTASHNPAPWNGLKLFGDDGAVLSASRGKELESLYDKNAFRHAGWDKLGRLISCTDAENWHLRRVLELVDVTRIRNRSFRVMLDANGGAGGPLGGRLLAELGCKTTILGGLPNGTFAHPPEPLAENLTSILEPMRASGAEIGFVLDPDADRLAILDENGTYIGEELTVALAALGRLRNEKTALVINMSSSRVTEDVAAKFGVTCERSAVGEANVVERMRQSGASLGGEGNGGVIDARVGWVRDPFIGMALILDLLAQKHAPLSEVVATLPKYEIVKTKIAIVASALPTLYTRLIEEWPAVRSTTLDGLRLDWKDRWVHVRPSNTEPIVRVIAEAPTREESEKLCAHVAALASKPARS